MFLLLSPSPGWAQAIFGGILFEEYCATCHGDPAPGSRAPTRETLRQFTPERILDALTNGAMAIAVASANLSDEEKRHVAEWAAGRKIGSTGGDAASMPNQCPSKPFDDPFAGAVWNGWSPDV